MTWNDITVEQYQQATKIIAKDITDLDKQDELICLLYDITPKQLNELSLSEYREKKKGVSFIFTEIPGKAKKYIKANSLTYFVNYRIESQRYGQYIESVTFSGSYIDNLHYLMASVCQPVKNILGIKKILPNKSEDHEKKSEDMLKAKFIDVYHAAIFFYRIYKGSMLIIRDYLVSEIIAKGQTKDQAEQMMEASLHAMDGFITPKFYSRLSLTI